MDAKFIAELGDAFEEFKGRYEGKHTDLLTRLEQVEVKMDRPNFHVAGGFKGEYVSPQDREHAELFVKWIRNPHSHELKHQLENLETKVASGTADASGGFAVPEMLLGQIESRVRDENPLRDWVRVVTVGSSDFKIPVSNNDATTGWVGETDTRTATSEPTGAQVSPTFGTIYSYVEATEELMLDSQFDIRSWLIESIGDAMAEAEAQAIVSGNGTKKPTGFLNAAPEATGDDDSPARTVGALEYLPTGDATSLGALSTTSPENYPADSFVDLVYRVRSQYRRRGAWFMNSATTGEVRKLKDADGRYLWRDGVAMGQPASILGFPVVTVEAMPDIAAGAHPIAFGDLSRAYTLCTQGGLRITVDDNITKPGSVKFYVRRRLGGKVVNDDALKVLKIATS